MYILALCIIATKELCLCALPAGIICGDVRTCIVATTKVVPVSSLQLSAVVLPLILLQMVNEVALVQPLGQQ